MIPVRLSYRYEFTPVPIVRSVVVYMIPVQNFIPVQAILARVDPGSCTGMTFSFRDKKSYRYHVKMVRF